MKMNIMALSTLLVICALLIGAIISAAWAQENPAETNPTSKPFTVVPEAVLQAHLASSPRQPTQSISTEQAVYLVRSALLTLNDANRSGNYTVLRDLASPDFQAKNTAADLTQSFADLRRRNFVASGSKAA